jgi:hypothetical protein
MFNELNSENFELFAAKYYRNPACMSIRDFKEDLLRFKYINRLLRRYETTNDLKLRLLLNHVIIIYNVFELKAANRLIFYRTDLAHWGIIKTILSFLNYIGDGEMSEVATDLHLTKKLREL